MPAGRSMPPTSIGSWFTLGMAGMLGSNRSPSHPSRRREGRIGAGKRVHRLGVVEQGERACSPIWLPVVSWPPTSRFVTMSTVSSRVRRSPWSSASTSVASRCPCRRPRVVGVDVLHHGVDIGEHLDDRHLGGSQLLRAHDPERGAEGVTPPDELGEVRLGRAQQMCT